MLFTELLQSAAREEGTSRLQVSDDWLQGRSLFGGLQAALAVYAMRGLVEAELPLRTLQVTFMAPVPAGEVSAQARILRSGKNTRHLEAKLLQGNETLMTAIGVFGTGRQSTIRLAPEQPPVDNSGAEELPFMPGLSPAFMQHFTPRWLRGGLPFSGSELPETVIEVDFKDSDEQASELHAIALADFPPPVALSMLKEMSAGSSLTWMLEFLTDDFASLPLQGWRIDARMLAARDGYTNQSCRVWGPGGVPVALSRQSMVVFG